MDDILNVYKHVGRNGTIELAQQFCILIFSFEACLMVIGRSFEFFFFKIL